MEELKGRSITLGFTEPEDFRMNVLQLKRDLEEYWETHVSSRESPFKTYNWKPYWEEN